MNGQEKKRMERHVMRMDAEGLDKISSDKTTAGRSSPGRPKTRWSELIPNQHL